MTATAAASSNRTCGTCTLCCKVFEVPPIDNKPRGVWCKHCKPGRGCGIWETRPDFCRDFHCLWIKEQSLGPEWKPEVAKFVMNWWDQNHLYITCDPKAPLAYRVEPYWTSLRDTARRIAPHSKILIFKQNDKYILLPDGEIRLGGRDEYVESRIVVEGLGHSRKYYAEVLHDGAVVRLGS